MRRAVVLVLGACFSSERAAVVRTARRIRARPRRATARGEPIVIRTRVNIADESGAEPIATGEVLEGSTLGGSPFCVGGTVLDTHGSSDPALFLIVETITCPDGTVSMAFTGGTRQRA